MGHCSAKHGFSPLVFCSQTYKPFRGACAFFFWIYPPSSVKNQATALQTEISTSEVTKRIHMLRGCQVMLDRDLAEIYEVETRILKRQVRNNIDRFPSDFVFTPTEDELETLRSKFRILNVGSSSDGCSRRSPRSKFRILKSEDGSVETRSSSFATMAFTELGVAMISSVLNSKTAAHVNIAIMRVFVQLRKGTTSQQHDLMPKLESMENMFKQRFDQLQAHLQNHGAPAASLQRVPPKHQPVSTIQNAVARYFGLSSDDLKSASRTQAVSLPRQIAIYLARKNLGMGFTEIGQHFGGRDHSTVLHSYRKILSDSETNIMIRTAVDVLQNEIRPMLS